MVRVPVPDSGRENGFWINFKTLYGLPKQGTAYLVAGLNSPRATPAEIESIASNALPSVET